MDAAPAPQARPHPPPEAPRAEPLLRGLLRAALLAAAGGALIGALEALAVLVPGEVRTTREGARIALAASATYAVVGALLALPGALAARVLYGRPQHRAAPPSACAGLGAVAALAAFVLVPSLSNAGLLAAALAGTLLALALKELLGWWTKPASARAWWALAGVAWAASAGASHALGHSGPASLACAGLAGLGLLAAATSLASRAAPRWITALAGALPAAALIGQWNAGYPRTERAAVAGERPNVLHVSIDTLRADRLGCYGNAAARTPTIDGLAAAGVLFEQATAQANTTGPSHTTQLTGLYPVEHGALANGRPIAADVPTLPELLGGAPGAWDTAGFVSGYTLFDGACGLARRFDLYDDNLLAWQWLPQAAEEIAALERIAFRLAGRLGTRVQRSDRPARWTVDAALDWLAARAGRANPFYLFLHLYDPHAPYEPPPEHAGGLTAGRQFDWYRLGSAERERLVADDSARGQMLALYEGEIAYADAELGRLLAALEQRGELERTLVIMTSDHGEGLGDHGYYFDHGSFLFDEELHVPLILRLPGQARAGTRVAGQTRLLDLVPTVLELCGVAPPPRLSGASLAPLFNGPGGAAAAERRSFALSEMAGDVSGFAVLGRRVSLRTGELKLIWTSAHWRDTEREPERYELFDLAADPGEQHDLYARDLPETPALRQELDAWRAAIEALAEGGELDPALLEHLRELGYL
jgi:arylsulfatase A-like enzyme